MPADLHTNRSTSRPDLRRIAPFRLLAIGVMGQLLAYAVTVTLARVMPIDAFESYVSAAALFVVMVSLAPMGSEKLSLRVLPPLRQRADWVTIQAYLRFAALRSALGIALVLGLIGIAAAGSGLRILDLSSIGAVVVGLALASLPFGVVAHHGLEILTALGRPTLAAVLFRVAMPALVLSLVALAALVGLQVRAGVAILAWGIGWCVVGAMMVLAIRRLRPADRSPALGAGSGTDPRRRQWTRAARPLWAYRVGFAIMGSAGILALDLLRQPATVVGAYAAATAIVGLMTVIVTSTNRVYASQLAIHIETDDPAAIRDLGRSRRFWVLPTIAAGTVLLAVFPDPLLSLFGQDFVVDGRAPLRILAATAALSMLLAMTPTELKYRNRNDVVLGGLAIGALVQLALLVVLVPRFGGAGAAAAHFAAIAGMHMSFAGLQRPGRT